MGSATSYSFTHQVIDSDFALMARASVGLSDQVRRYASAVKMQRLGLAFGTLLGVAIVLLNLGQKPSADPHSDGIALGIGFAFIAVFGINFARSVAKPIVRVIEVQTRTTFQSPECAALLLTRRLQFGPDGVIDESTSRTVKFPWNAVIGIVDDATSVTVRVNFGTGLFLPPRVFESKEQQRQFVLDIRAWHSAAARTSS